MSSTTTPSIPIPKRSSNPTTERQWRSYGEEGQRKLVEGIAMPAARQPEDIANGVLVLHPSGPRG